MARETELKFLVDPDFEIPTLDAAGVGIESVLELPSQALSAIYYDTDDLRLARCGLTLRHRTGEDGQPAWTLKLPVIGDANSRDEVTYDAGPGDPPAEALALVTAYARGKALRPVTQLKTRRLKWSLMSPTGRQLAELVDDRVSVLNGAAIVDRFREIEIESKGLDADGLRIVARVMRRAGAAAPDPTPKALRALGERARAPADWAAPPPPSPNSPVSEAVKMSLAAAAQRAMTHDPSARLDNPEGVHQMRVAVRRLRSDLRMFAPIVDAGWAQELKAELRWLADVLGPARDTDVLIARLKRDSEDLGDALAPLFAEMEQSRSAATTTLRAGLGDPRYVALLERLLRDAREPRVLPGAADPCRRVMPRLVAETWRPLAQGARRLTAFSADEEFHAVRILAKRTRYAAEAAAPCLGPQTQRAAIRFARRAEEIQNVLGEHQDAVIAQRKLLEATSGRWEDGPFSFALGRLLERQSSASERSRARFYESWSKFDQKGMRIWLTSRGSR